MRPDLKPTLRFANTGDLIFAGVGETVEDVGRSVAWLGDAPVAVHDDCFVFRSDMDPTFLAYVTQTARFNQAKDRHVSRAKVKRLSATGLGQIEVPVPALSSQRQIVTQFNQFDALVNDISIGLPAELAARRKQYEYYRDNLLTFPEQRS